MIEIVETPVALEVRDRLRPGMRVVFGLLALFPLLAPYELIIRPKWESYLNFPFLFVLIIVAGALVVSAFLLMAAVAGLNTLMVFDRISGMFTFSRSAPVVPLRTFRYPFAEVETVEIESHDWSEGAPTYSLRAVMKDGRAFSTGSSSERPKMEDALRRAQSILGSR